MRQCRIAPTRCYSCAMPWPAALIPRFRKRTLRLESAVVGNSAT
jgi:hypothetical protein